MDEHVPNQISVYLIALRSLSLNPPSEITIEFRLLAYLLAKADEIGANMGFAVGDRAICEHIGIDRFALSRYRNSLVEKGYLEVFGTNNQQPTEYRLWKTCGKLVDNFSEIQSPSGPQDSIQKHDKPDSDEIYQETKKTRRKRTVEKPVDVQICTANADSSSVQICTTDTEHSSVQICTVDPLKRTRIRPGKVSPDAGLDDSQQETAVSQEAAISSVQICTTNLIERVAPHSGLVPPGTNSPISICTVPGVPGKSSTSRSGSGSSGSGSSGSGSYSGSFNSGSLCMYGGEERVQEGWKKREGREEGKGSGERGKGGDREDGGEKRERREKTDDPTNTTRKEQTADHDSITSSPIFVSLGQRLSEWEIAFHTMSAGQRLMAIAHCALAYWNNEHRVYGDLTTSPLEHDYVAATGDDLQRLLDQGHDYSWLREEILKAVGLRFSKARAKEVKNLMRCNELIQQVIAGARASLPDTQEEGIDEDLADIENYSEYDKRWLTVPPEKVKALKRKQRGVGNVRNHRFTGSDSSPRGTRGPNPGPES